MGGTGSRNSRPVRFSGDPLLYAIDEASLSTSMGGSWLWPDGTVVTLLCHGERAPPASHQRSVSSTTSTECLGLLPTRPRDLPRHAPMASWRSPVVSPACPTTWTVAAMRRGSTARSPSPPPQTAASSSPPRDHTVHDCHHPGQRAFRLTVTSDTGSVTVTTGPRPRQAASHALTPSGPVLFSHDATAPRNRPRVSHSRIESWA